MNSNLMWNCFLIILVIMWHGVVRYIYFDSRIIKSYESMTLEEEYKNLCYYQHVASIFFLNVSIVTSIISSLMISAIIFLHYQKTFHAVVVFSILSWLTYATYQKGRHGN